MSDQLQYREIGKNDLKKFSKMLDYAFALQEGEKEYKSEEDYREIMGAARGMYKGDELLSCFELFEFDCRMRDVQVKLAGIGGVASPPENRRKGYIKAMFNEALHEMKNNDFLLSSLWPFSFSFYRKLGYEQATGYKNYLLKPQRLKFTAKYNSGEFRKVSLADYRELNEVYKQHYRDYDLVVDKSKEWWEKRIAEENYIYILERENDPTGYIVYSVEEDPDADFKKRMKVREIAAVDYENYMECLRFLYNHDSQIARIWMNVSTDDLLPKFLPEPGIEENCYQPGAMFRIIDVRELLSTIKYPPDYTGSLVFRVNDNIIGENDVTFILEVEGGKGRCRESSRKPEFEVDINHLTPVVTGYISPGQAYQIGQIKVREEKVVGKLQKIFPSRKTCFLVFF